VSGNTESHFPSLWNPPATDSTQCGYALGELEEAIGKVPLEQRQVILLVGLEGMSYDEVAAILMVPVGTVRSRLSRGRSALRRLMSMEEEQPEAVAA
jgi:RNA polymerase sigma-70 factor (ECF subfamily)